MILYQKHYHWRILGAAIIRNDIRQWWLEINLWNRRIQVRLIANARKEGH